MRDPHYGQMCFKSVKTLGALHSQLWKRPRPSASAFFPAKNVELLGLYPIRKVMFWYCWLVTHTVCSPDYLKRDERICISD